MQRVIDVELDYPGDDGLYYLNDKPFTGIAYSGFEDEPDEEQEYRDGMVWGIGMSWYGSGALKSDSQWVGGVYHGLRREFREDGKLALLEAWEHGVCLWRRRWNKAGKLVEDHALPESASDWETVSILRGGFVRSNRQTKEPPEPQ